MNGWAILNGARNGARIPNAAGAMGRVARPVKYGGDYGKPWRGALFHRVSPVKYGGDNGKPWPARSARPPPTG